MYKREDLRYDKREETKQVEQKAGLWLGRNDFTPPWGNDCHELGMSWHNLIKLDIVPSIPPVPAGSGSILYSFRRVVMSVC
jgi:hypothetical protein